jgi:hypothetical protein
MTKSLLQALLLIFNFPFNRLKSYLGSPPAKEEVRGSGHRGEQTLARPAAGRAQPRALTPGALGLGRRSHAARASVRSRPGTRPLPAVPAAEWRGGARARPD